MAESERPVMERGDGPDFLIIGVQHGATTWLHQRLWEHPHVWLPPVKELHYFDSIDSQFNEYATHKRSFRLRYFPKRSLQSLLRERRMEIPWTLRFYGGDGSIEWYRELFMAAKRRGMIAGEATPAYSMVNQEAVDTAKGVNPHLRVIFIARDPVKRLWSSLSRALERKDRMIDPTKPDSVLAFARRPGVAARSDYVETLARWTSAFPSSRVKVFLMEDVKGAPDDMVGASLRHIGADPSLLIPSPKWMSAVNRAPSSAPKPSDAVAAALRDHYRPMITEFASRYDARASQWLHEA